MLAHALEDLLELALGQGRGYLTADQEIRELRISGRRRRGWCGWLVGVGLEIQEFLGRLQAFVQRIGLGCLGRVLTWGPGGSRPTPPCLRR